jgi:hypothetical protein
MEILLFDQARASGWRLEGGVTNVEMWLGLNPAILADPDSVKALAAACAPFLQYRYSIQVDQLL